MNKKKAKQLNGLTYDKLPICSMNWLMSNRGAFILLSYILLRRNYSFYSYGINHDDVFPLNVRIAMRVSNLTPNQFRSNLSKLDSVGFIEIMPKVKGVTSVKYIKVLIDIFDIERCQELERIFNEQGGNHLTYI